MTVPMLALARPPALLPLAAGEVSAVILNISPTLPMMEMDARLWCGACPPRQAATGSGTLDMHESNMTRISGSDVAWPAWPAPSDRVDAPRPDVVRPETAWPVPAEHPPADEAESRSVTTEKASAAAFPTSYARFSINAETQKLSIAIVDAATDEVIREIPPEQVQRIAEDLQSMARRTSIGKRPAPADRAAQAASRGVDRYV